MKINQLYLYTASAVVTGHVAETEERMTTTIIRIRRHLMYINIEEYTRSPTKDIDRRIATAPRSLIHKYHATIIRNNTYYHVKQ